MSRKIFFASIVVIVIIAGIVFYRTGFLKGHLQLTQTYSNVSNTNTNNSSSYIHYEIATTTIALERGLSGRKVIPNNYAMLFVFPKDGRYGFWMKDMLAPIDIVWLSDNGTIIYIKDTVQPNTYPHIFYPPAYSRYVIETRAGYSKKHSWYVGHHINLPGSYGKNILK